MTPVTAEEHTKKRQEIADFKAKLDLRPSEWDFLLRKHLGEGVALHEETPYGGLLRLCAELGMLVNKKQNDRSRRRR